MNGYSKLILVNSKSRSIDFSDLSAIDSTLSRQTQNVHENIPPSPTSESDDQDTDTVDHQDHDQSSPPIPKQQQQQKQKQDEDEHQAACSSVGAKYLSKDRSVSPATSSSQRFKLERERITTTKRGIQSALRRAFSTRRSSTPSVSHEKYCRIHDQCVAILLDDDDVDEDVFEAMEDNNNVTGANSIGSPEKKKFGILKACKRILGF